MKEEGRRSDDDDDVCAQCEAGLLYAVDGVEYSRRMGYIEPGVYDGVLLWVCPFCGHRWHRHPAGSRLRDLAQPYLREAG